jgi:hypothetical protein
MKKITKITEMTASCPVCHSIFIYEPEDIEYIEIDDPKDSSSTISVPGICCPACGCESTLKEVEEQEGFQVKTNPFRE